MTIKELKLLKELLDEFQEEYRDYEHIGVSGLLEMEINSLESNKKS